MNILFVCTGNTCRSSMAHVLAQRELDRLGASFVNVKSAGTDTDTGLPASENAILVMGDIGLDLTGHRATALDKKMLEEADIILVMAERHLEKVISALPEAKGKAYMLKDYAGLKGDVVDPYGGDRDVYSKTAGELAELVKIAVDKLLKELNENK